MVWTWEISTPGPVQFCCTWWRWVVDLLEDNPFVMSNVGIVSFILCPRSMIVNVQTAKIPRQNHFSTPTLSLSDSVHCHQRDIHLFRIKTTSGVRRSSRGIRGGIQISDRTWYTDFLCCVSVVVEPHWRHAYCWTSWPSRLNVVATSWRTWRVEF
jgi:hypothetical protein